MLKNLLEKIQKIFGEKNKNLTYGVVALAVIALAIVVVWQPGEWSFTDKTDYSAQQQQAAAELAQYNAFLAQLDPNYVASQQLLEKIASEDIVRQQIEETLQTKQKIVIPQVANADVNISNRKDTDFVVNYLTDLNSMVTNYKQAVNPAASNLFASSSSLTDLASAKAETAKFLASMRGMAVPSNLVDFHKANMVAFQQYGKIFDQASTYNQDPNNDPWPDFYQSYSVIDNRMAVVNSELTQVSKQYALSESLERATGPPFINVAQAQFGGVVVVTTDLQRDILEGIKLGLAKAFANFSIQMLDKLVAHIEKSFAIASQLYYSNELGRYYSVEYMKKFVSDPLDQGIIQKFLPEYFCVNPNPADLNKIFVAKAAANAGNDITINPNDPDFAQKLARLGSDVKNYPQWWEGYYESLAAQTKAEADAAATKEVLSPGVKTGRDLVNNQINKTVSAIFSVQEAAISGVINLGTNNTENPVGQLVSGVVESLVNKFVFTPISTGQSSSGGIGVLQEKDVCLQTQQIKPLIPLGSTDYQSPTGATTTAPVVTPPFSPRN